eukprot:1105252-Prorocentrum_minimum.AAC.6
MSGIVHSMIAVKTHIAGQVSRVYQRPTQKDRGAGHGRARACECRASKDKVLPFLMWLFNLSSSHVTNYKLDILTGGTSLNFGGSVATIQSIPSTHGIYSAGTLVLTRDASRPAGHISHSTWSNGDERISRESGLQLARLQRPADVRTGDLCTHQI